MSDDIETIAESLAFDLNDDDIADCRESADRLADIAAGVSDDSERTVERTGSLLEDEYGALLDGFETPRTRETGGPLADQRIVVKDNIAVEHLGLTCGSAGFEYVPGFDATVVERLLEAGGELLGKANMDAFAFGPTGEFSGRADVVNPIAADRVPGGSSSGSGVAVATGLADVALGTDTGGSVRIPAACCGVVGVKPTFGHVSTHGVVPFAPSLDTVGPLARSVETAADALSAISDERTADSFGQTSSPSESQAVAADSDETFTVGVVTEFLEECSETVTRGVRSLCGEVESASELELEEVSVDLGSIEDAYLLVGATEFAWYLRQRGLVRGNGSTYARRWSRALREFVDDDGFSDHVAKRVLPSATLDAETDGDSYVAGRLEAEAFGRRLEAAFDRVDVLLVPTLRTLPPERGDVSAHDRLFDVLGNTAPFNLTGNPAVTLPVDGADGLPISVQVVAPRHDDGVAIDCARVFEEIVAESASLEPPALPA
ncbi:aspartyl-tRNA(Asn)/glutamyl-tRNA(Gln) amidotransferase subunit A [Natronorubrum sediminis]|uniref:Aspartyl-tRNA(Asn)/glutamyl-tRNA(Gln) amidotransferase subunit A n=1 Tax=Natronorubrum sediminis TaxID=640943 RepID=A0A1H6FXW6_9EURY|nr:amidase [Natronorubrum sediminis]SEH15661.1 aspartyl-tRNA(Asn)/glutamyl-tRNA(Gln) amidotransferase subunit A [Natronorubrum sediminis]